MNHGDGWCGNNIEPGTNWVMIDRHEGSNNYSRL